MRIDSHLLLVALNTCHREQQGDTVRAQVPIRCLVKKCNSRFITYSAVHMLINLSKNANNSLNESNLEAFKEFSPKFMVKSYSKDYVEDSSTLDMP